jgi:hypothetical protein
MAWNEVLTYSKMTPGLLRQVSKKYSQNHHEARASMTNGHEDWTFDNDKLYDSPEKRDRD